MAIDVAQTSDPDTSTGDQTLEQAHAQLRALLGRLETLNDLREEGDLVEHLLPLLRAHFEEEEAPGGFYDDLREDAPNREADIRRLAADHQRLLSDAVLLGEELRGLERAVTRVHARKAALIANLLHHEQAENELMLDAVSLDLGVGD